MKKLTFVFSIIFSFAFLLFGCMPTETSGVNSTDLGIYDLYYSNMFRCQVDLVEKISIDDFASSDQIKANSILTNINIVDQDEIAIMASIECFDVATTPKEISVDVQNGLIFVRLQNGKYVCEISYGDNTNVSYSFDIKKDSSNGAYKITYKKQNVDCSATVVFSKQIGFLSSNITTITENNQRVETRKQFYLLRNSYMAYRMNFSIGTDNNRGIYCADFFKEVFNFKAKLSSLVTWSSAINEDNLTLEKFVARNKNDYCGYIVKHNDGIPTNVSPFGDLIKF